MQHDDIIWRLLKDSFCSFRAKLKKEKQAFCRNPYSCTGLCNRRTCPLANSKYATLREEDGNIFLYMKTVERAHTPRDLWEKIKLPRNYTQALKIIDEKLQYSPLLNHKNKQRLTRIHQCLIRMRRLKRSIKPVKEVIRKKIERRDAHRERAAHIENSIEAELLERLKKGTYGDIYNFPEQEFNDIIDVNEEETEQEKAEEARTEYVEDFEPSDDEIEDYANFEGTAFGEDGLEEEEDGDDGDDDSKIGKEPKPKKDKHSKKPKKGKGGKKKHMEIEYEEETEDQMDYNK